MSGLCQVSCDESLWCLQLHSDATLACYVFCPLADNRFLLSSSAGCTLPAPSCASPEQQPSLLLAVNSCCHKLSHILWPTIYQKDISISWSLHLRAYCLFSLHSNPTLYCLHLFTVMFRSPMKAFPLLLYLFYSIQMRALSCFSKVQGSLPCGLP